MAKVEAVIGKEEGQHRLLVKVGPKAFTIGSPQSVPNSVSRTHCSLTVDFSEDTKRTVTQMKIKNIKSQNITYVDGHEVESKSIKETSVIQLGYERYNMNLQNVIDGMRKIIGPGQEYYPISHLEKIWQEYDEEKLKISDSSAKLANKQRLQGLLSMSAMFIGFIPGIDQIVRGIIIAAALVVGVYLFIKGSSGSTIQRKMHDLDNEFIKKYTCPNPSCNHFIGNIPYDVLKQNVGCPYCKCKYKK